MSATSNFFSLLTDQVRHEFTASQQYAAIAIWCDSHDLPQLAARFYAQSVEERNHAMMMVQFCMDRDVEIGIPGIDDVINEFSKPTDVIALAVKSEITVTEQVSALFKAAREENDPLSEQFMLWFLKEQTEEVASMRTLLTIAERAGEDWFQIEEYLDREAQSEGSDPSAPAVAGGQLG